MEIQHAEGLLRDYLLCHPPKPFQNFITDGMDSSNTRYMVFRRPGTLHDLVISVKFLPEGNTHQHTTPQSTDESLIGAHWEHAMVGGMDWRRKMNHEYSSRSPTQPSLIVTSTFTNAFGFELVGHVEESHMEDVQFRFRASTAAISPMSCPNEALQYIKILGEVQIYRWKPRDEHKIHWNLIGFISPESTPTNENTKLCFSSLSEMTKRNDIDAMTQSQTHLCPSNNKDMPKDALSSKRLPSYLSLPFCWRSTATPNPRGPFVWPHLFMNIRWAPTRLSGRPPKIPNRKPTPSPRRKSGINRISPPPGFEQNVSPQSYSNTSKTSSLRAQCRFHGVSSPGRMMPVQEISFRGRLVENSPTPTKANVVRNLFPTERRIAGSPKMKQGSRDHRQHLRGTGIGMKTTIEGNHHVGAIVRTKSPRAQQNPAKSSNGDIAINLLCPYRYSKADLPFFPSNETPNQRAMRHTIEISPCCNHLQGKFVLEFVPRVTFGRYPPSPSHYQWAVRKATSR